MYINNDMVDFQARKFIIIRSDDEITLSDEKIINKFIKKQLTRKNKNNRLMKISTIDFHFKGL
jgi:hypothetical protein